MNSYPGSTEVVDDLGDKVVHGLGAAVARTREDLDDYRNLRPAWVLRHGPRGLANWIQDQLWAHVVDQLDSVAGVVPYESGPTREVIVNRRYRIRIKRHHLLGEVSIYPTQTALEFLDQPSGQLPGLEEIHLISGYEWDRDERRIVRPVLSLRDGLDSVVWIVELPETASGSATIVTLPPVGGPPAPAIEVSNAFGQIDLDEGEA